MMTLPIDSSKFHGGATGAIRVAWHCGPLLESVLKNATSNFLWRAQLSGNVSKSTKWLVAVFYSASVCSAIVPCTKHVLGLYLGSRGRGCQ